MSKTATIAINETTSQKLKALFAGEMLVAIVKSGKVKFSNGNSEWIAPSDGMADGTYHVTVNEATHLQAVTVSAPETKKGLISKVADSISGADKERAPRVRSSGSAGATMASMRR